jgi:hypothetical protein
MPSEGSLSHFDGFRPLRVEKLKNVPFSAQSMSMESWGLEMGELRIIVAIMAGEAAGHPVVTLKQVRERCGVRVHKSLTSLVCRRWLECTGQAGTRERLFKATDRAFREFGLWGWQPEGEALQSTEAADSGGDS